jgi:glycosyltransferase involved in cell wall biosynthesis
VNVVIINDNAQVNGGAAKVAIMEAAGLAERGHQIFFVSAVPPIDADLLRPNIRVLCSEQFDLLANPNRLQAFVQGWWNIKASQLTRNLLAQLDRRETIVHLHVWSRALSSSVVRAAIDANLKPVCTLHDFMLACPTGTFFLHPQQEICHLRPMGFACMSTNCDTRSYPQKLWRVGRQVIQEKFGCLPTGLTDFIAHSRLARQIMEPYLPSGNTVHQITSYIESSRQQPANAGENDTFVYLGRLVREKGVCALARCAAAERFPLTFVGSGPLEGALRAIYPDAVFTGWMDHAASMQYLRTARALIFPSLWYETFGLVVLEAAANGIPSIVPDTSAARELVIDGVTGLHFRRGDEDDLRSKMRQLQDPQFATKLGRAAYDSFWSSEYPSREAHISSLETIYQTIMQRDQRN